MPATSEKMAHTAQMAAAVKGGHASLRSMPKGARKAIKSMMSMSREQLHHFMHTRKKG